MKETTKFVINAFSKKGKENMRHYIDLGTPTDLITTMLKDQLYHGAGFYIEKMWNDSVIFDPELAKQEILQVKAKHGPITTDDMGYHHIGACCIHS